LQDKKETVKNIEALIDILPDNVKEEEKEKVKEIKEMLLKINQKIDKESETISRWGVWYESEV